MALFYRTLAVGFVHQNVAGFDLFLDGPEGSVRSAIHVVFAREKVRPDYLLPARAWSETAGIDRVEGLRSVRLAALNAGLGPAPGQPAHSVPAVA